MICKKHFLLLIIYILFFQTGKSQVLRLEMKGKDSLETAVIDSVSYNGIHPSFNSLSSEIDSVFRLLQKSGYVDAQIFPATKMSDSLYVSKMFLGRKFRIFKISRKNFSLKSKLLEKVALEVDAKYFSIPISQTENVLGLLNNEIAKQGRPFSFLRLRNIRKSGDTLFAKLSGEAAGYRKIDGIAVKGYEKFPVSYLKHFLGIKTNRIFNKELLEKKMERLHNLPFAGSIKPPEVQFTRDSTIVYLYLEKEKSNTFDGFLGFSNDTDNDKLQLTGNVDFLLLNNLNYGESLNVRYSNDGEAQVNFEANLELPYLFQSPVGLALGLEIFKKDSSYVTVEQKVKATYRFGPKTSVYLGYRRMESNNLLEEIFAGSSVEDYVSNYMDLGGTYTDYSKFNELFPIKTIIAINFGFGERDRSGKRNTQFMLHANAGHILELDRRNAVYLHNESAMLSSEDPLANELFRFGGIGSLRGFAENSIFADLFSATQTEYRYILSSNLYVHSIIDHAYYENKVLGRKENLYGIGFGLGLKSGAGILKVNFANGKADGQKFEFANTVIHLSLTTKF